MSTHNDDIDTLLFEHWGTQDDHESEVIGPDSRIYDMEDDEDREAAIRALLDTDVLDEKADLVRGLRRALKEGAEFEDPTFNAILELYRTRGGADHFRLVGDYLDKIDWVERMTADLFGEIPDHVVVDWNRTADGLLELDYIGIETDGRFVAFRVG